MAETTLLLNGFSILGDPHTNTNAKSGGNLMIHDGTAVFESDDIIVFTISGALPDGTLTDDSIITGIVVYDNASDYFNDTPKYTYSSSTGGADLDTGRNSMGERYLEFDATLLTSTDAGAPVLGNMAVVAGIDVFAALANSKGPLSIATQEDIDANGDGIISPDEVGDGIMNTGILAGIVAICFAEGTLIETPDGLRAIESLEAGDMVNTMDNGAQRINWIGGMEVEGTGSNAPVRIKRGTLGNTRDLWVSQNHRVLVAGATAELLFGEPEVLVAAKHLVNDDTIRVIPRRSVTYYHFLFEQHQIVFAESCPAESLYPGQESLNSVSDDERDEIIELFPSLASASCPYGLSRYTLKGYEARALRLSA